MKNGLLISVVAIQLIIALTSSGATRSLAELAAFLIIAFAVLSRRGQRQSSKNDHDAHA
jgi:hypothetical protein